MAKFAKHSNVRCHANPKHMAGCTRISEGRLSTRSPDNMKKTRWNHRRPPFLLSPSTTSAKLTSHLAHPACCLSSTPHTPASASNKHSLRGHAHRYTTASNLSHGNLLFQTLVDYAAANLSFGLICHTGNLEHVRGKVANRSFAPCTCS